MAVVIDATVGGAASNSYVTEAEAIAYAATRLNLPDTWVTTSGSTATETEKKAMVEATREIDLLTYKGRRLASTQRLAWPRAYALNEEDFAVDVLLPSYDLDVYYDGIPQRLKDATIELAFEFLRAGTVDLAAAPDDRVMVRRKVDVLETEWEPGDTQNLTGIARYPRVAALVAPLLIETGNRVLRQ